MVGETPVVVAARYSEQASVADWPMRILLTLGVLAVILLILGAARWGWRRRVQRQGFDAASSKALVDPSSPGDGRLRAKYLGTAFAGNLFERVNAGGGPAQVTLTLPGDDFQVIRNDRPLVPVSLSAISSVDSGPGLLQKSYHRHGVILLTWSWDGRDVVSGFWIANPADHERVLRLLRESLRTPTITLEGDA